MLTPGRGTLPAFTVPCTSPPAEVLGGVFTAGAAAAVDCACAGATMRSPANRHTSGDRRCVKVDFESFHIAIGPGAPSLALLARWGKSRFGVKGAPHSMTASFIVSSH